MTEQRKVQKKALSSTTVTPNTTEFLQTRPFADANNCTQQSRNTSKIAHSFGDVGIQQKSQIVNLQKDETEQNKKDENWIYDTLQQVKSWDKIKSQFMSDKDTMREIVEYRKLYVDSKINQLRNKYQGLIAKSVGSKDLTSDYDLTISTPNTGEDVEAVDDFNKMIKSEFGVQPGTLFDTNLYAKDYLRVKENLQSKQKQQDTELEEPENQYLGRLTDLDQDVSSLVKQRRFMNQIEWDKYTQAVVSQIEDEKQKKAVLKQYEEADSIYQISAHELLKAAKNDDKLSKNKAKLGEEEKAELAKIKNSKIREQVEMQLLGMEELNLINHENADLVLEKSNQLYIDKMRQVRVLQCLIQNPENENNIDAMKAEVKKLLGQACFFAAEAYHSEGAVKHVVAGLQGDSAEDALAKLKPEHILQSYNEQLGDFLKDIVHYTQEKADPGKVFYRSSKYLYRLFDAVKEIKKRKKFADIQLNIGDENLFATIIESGLLAIRKGKPPFDQYDEKTNNKKAVEIVQQNFGVQTPEKLKQKVLHMSIDFNQKVRNKLSLMANENAESEYFQSVQVK